MSVQKPIKTSISITVAAIMAASAHAGSFSLYTEGNGAATGNYAAGIAAEAADASIGWYNPAGLALLHDEQAVFGAVGVAPDSILTGSSIYHTPGFPDYIQSYSNINGGKNALVPSFHYARPLGENSTVGLSVVSPFGLSTDWGRAGPVRYAATVSELVTTNISPEIGGRLSENFAIGAGVDLQYARVKFNQIIGSPATLDAIGQPPILFDSYSYNSGHSFGVGFHAGLMMMVNDDHTRIGLNYQSIMNHKFHGYSRLKGRLASPTLSDDYAVFMSNHLSSNSIELPDIVTLSGYHDVNESWAVLGSVVYTGWQSLKTIQLNNVAAFVPVTQALVDSVATEYYKNVWRFSVGANYKVNTRLMMRAGLGYDQTPTRDAYRDVRIADSNRWATAIGAHYQARPNIGLDLGYTHLFSQGDWVNKTQAIGTSSYTVSAHAKGSADLVGVQLTWLMDGVEPSNMKA
ncbi:MAG: outer membrane protein transport protein [Legionella sp.]|nr:outer membrane protein transport protein [Legionella sp.]